LKGQRLFLQVALVIREATEKIKMQALRERKQRKQENGKDQ
jgi:hypothetical protein